MITFAADVGGTRIKLALVRDRIVLARETLDAQSGDGLAPQLPRIAETFKRLCNNAGIAREDCAALGVAFPSLVDTASGRILTEYGKYADAPQLDLPRWARGSLGLECMIENDARAAILGEWQAGAGRGSDDLVMVTLGTGLGTSAIIGGKLLRGKHGQAGVLGGHVTVRLDGRLCTCGNRGCAEAEASTSVLPRIAREHPDFSHSRLRDLDVIDYAGVFRLARESDACAAALRAHGIEIWAAMIVNLIHAYDPERVIVGGGIVAGAADFLSDIERIVRSRAHTPWGRVEIMPAELGDDAALIGCEFLVREKRSFL